MQVPIAFKVPIEIKRIYDELSEEQKEFLKLVLITFIAGLKSQEVPDFKLGTKKVEVKIDVGENLSELLKSFRGPCLSQEKLERLQRLIRSYRRNPDMLVPAHKVAELLEELLSLERPVPR